MANPAMLIAGVLGLSLGIYGASKEAPVLGYGISASIETTEAIRNQTLGPTLSYYGHKRLMLECAQSMTGLWYSVADQGQREMLAKSCLRYALEYTDSTPIDSFGWLIAARASFTLNDIDGMNRYLAYSKAAGPNEQWIAAHRVELWEAARSSLSQDNQARANSDLALMVTSLTGIKAVAQRYISDSDFRDRITEIVEKLPERDQRRFISNVRRAAAN